MGPQLAVFKSSHWFLSDEKKVILHTSSSSMVIGKRRGKHWGKQEGNPLPNKSQHLFRSFPPSIFKISQHSNQSFSLLLHKSSNLHCFKAQQHHLKQNNEVSFGEMIYLQAPMMQSYKWLKFSVWSTDRLLGEKRYFFITGATSHLSCCLGCNDKGAQPTGWVKTTNRAVTFHHTGTTSGY